MHNNHLKRNKLFVGLLLAASSAGANAQSLALEELIVTATKKMQTVNDLGMAVSAFTGDQMRDLGVTNPTDVAKFTPGLVLTESAASGVPVYTIRGIGFDDYSSASSSTVGIYTDEISLPYPTMTRGLSFDIERLEVLKGPQGDLYGRNTTGGAINFYSNAPEDEFSAGITSEVARYNYLSVEGFVTGALTDNVNARLAIKDVRQKDGWQENEITGEENGELDQTAARLVVEWLPSDDVSVMFRAHAYSDKSDNQVPQYTEYVPVDPSFAFPPTVTPDLNDSGSAIWSIEPKRDNDGVGFATTINWDINEEYSLTSLTAYEGFERTEGNDWDGLDQANLDLINTTDIDAYSQEFRLSYDNGDDITWTAGLYLSSDEVDESYLIDVQDATAGGFIGDTRYVQETDTQALFGHFEWDFAQEFRFVAGLRATHEEREIETCTYDAGGVFPLTTLFNIDLFDFDFGGTGDDFFLSGTPLSPGDCVTVDPSQGSITIDANGPGTVAIVGGESAVFKGDIDTDNVSGKLEIDYLPNDDTLIYASFTTGFKSGGFNGAAASSHAQLQPFDEETLEALELGIKLSLLDQSMQLNASVFNYDYEDKQISDFLADPVFGPLTIIKNAPESEVNGAEIEVQWQPIEGLYTRVGVTYLDAELKDFQSTNPETLATEDLSGNSIPNTPRWQTTGMASYEWYLNDDLMMSVGGDFTYSDEQYSFANNSSRSFVDDYYLVNARVGLADAEDVWRVTGWVKNLEDKNYYTSTTFGNDTWVRYTGKGRTYGLTFSYNWM